MDGLTQWPALEANTVDGQDTVPNVDSASPGEGAQGRGWELDRALKWGSALGELRNPKAQAWLTPVKPTLGGGESKCDCINRSMKSSIWEGIFLLKCKS